MTQIRCNDPGCGVMHTIVGRDHYIDDVFHETFAEKQLRFQCTSGKHIDKDDDGSTILVPFYDIDQSNRHLAQFRYFIRNIGGNMGNAPSDWTIALALFAVFALYGILPGVLVLLNWTYLPVSDKWHWIITGVVLGIEAIIIYVRNPFKAA